jgi:hypothetical protein
MFTGIGYGMIALNLAQVEKPVIDGVIDSFLRGLKS